MHAPPPPARQLSELLTERAPLETAAAVRLGIGAASAVAEVHRSGRAHGGIHPGSLLLEPGPSGEIRIRLLERESSSPEPDVRYRAPERHTARTVDARADVWSLGVLLHEAVVGSLPVYDVADDGMLADAIATVDVPDLRSAAPWVDAELAAVVRQALRRDPSERFPDADALLSALQKPAGDHEPLTAGLLVTVGDAARFAARSGVETRATRDAPPDESPSDSQIGARFLQALVGQTLGGRYQLRGILGEGGMGAVFEASDSDGRAVAIKLIRPEAVSSGAVRRFLREARAAGEVGSPHVVPGLDAAGGGRGPFIVMELLRGRDLGDTIAALGPLEPRLAARLFSDACEGLAAAHEAGLVHRDIKPSNLFLHEEEDGTVTVKICDFGIAKESVLSENETVLTRTGGILGTPAYMSPEQAQDSKSVDARSDVWSLSAALYEAVAGTGPWHGAKNVGEMLASLYSREVPALQSVAPWVEPELSSAIHQGLVRDRAARLQSASALRALLEPIAQPGPVRTDDVRGVDDEARARKAQQLPRALDATEGTQPAPARRRWLVALLPVALGLGGVAVWRQASPEPPTSTPAAPAPRCVSARGCSAELGKPARCRPDGRCAALGSDLCTVDAEQAVIDDDATIWIGTMFPTDHKQKLYQEFGTSAQKATSLAMRELRSIAGGVVTRKGSTRPVGLVACRDAEEPAKAARHLVDEVGVPAVIGFGSSKSVVDLTTSLFLKNDVLVIPSLNTSAIIGSIPHPGGAPRLVWRTTANTTTRVEALAALMSAYIEPEVRRRAARRHEKGDVSVALVARHSSASMAVSAELAARLRFNGKSASENGDRFREFQLLDVESDPLQNQLTVANLRDFHPHVVVLGDVSDEMINGIVNPLEDGWDLSLGAGPLYVVNGSLEGITLGELLRRHPTVEDRLLGITSTTEPATLAFTRAYNAAYREQLPPGEAPSAPYDSVYLLVYALAAGAADDPGGASLARGIERLTSGEPVDVGPTNLLRGFSILAEGKSLDLRGAFGPLDFDPKTGESSLNYAALCARVRDGRHHFLESGLVYDAKMRAVRGDFTCRLAD